MTGVQTSLPIYLKARGVHVHWASDGQEARDIIVRIAQENQVKHIIKSKSMTSEEIHLNERIHAVKAVSMNEEFFQGHFPGAPIMPGVLQIEAMAQAAGILMLRKTSCEGRTAFFMSADKVKFRRPVRPGDQLLINAKITKARGDKLAIAECNCTVGGQVVSSAELMFGLVEEGEA